MAKNRLKPRQRNLFLGTFFLTVMLSVFSVALSILPVITNAPQGIFFGMDPDAVYVANALSYIKSHQIQFMGHPGTPTILLIAYSFTPLRLFAKYIIHQPFIDWAFLHYHAIFTYARLFQALVFGVSVFIFLTAVHHLSRSRLAVIFAWVALMAFRPVPFLGSVIAPETLSVALVSLWLLGFSLFLTKRFSALLLILSFLAGLAVANKTTNITLVLASLTLSVLRFRRYPLFSKLVHLFLNALIVSIGFLGGIWPIHNTIIQILKLNFDFASHTGIHGGGSQTFIDFSLFLSNTRAFHQQGPFILPLLIIGLLLVVFHLRFTKKLSTEIPLLYLVTLPVFIVFLKFNLFHYELANYLIFIFLISTYLATHLKPSLIFFSLFILWYLPISTQSYFRGINIQVNQAVALESYIKDHPPKIATAWVWGLARDFAYIWARDWTGGLFDSQIKRYRPDLLEVKSDFQKINLNKYDQKKVFDVCWDQLYLQQDLVPKFTALYPDRILTVGSIPNTRMAVISSAHCPPSPTQ